MSDRADRRPDPEVHKRYLDYRERHVYFGKLEKLLSIAEFIPLDEEHGNLTRKGEATRDDEEEARLEEVARLLFRD